MLSALIAAATVSIVIPEPPKLDVDAMLYAIRQCENWDGKTEGAAKEWTAYQFTPAVWQHTRIGKTKTMRQATPSEHHAAAREELLFRMASLAINHIEPTVCNLALSWTAGVSATINGTASEAKKRYALKCVALYQDARK